MSVLSERVGFEPITPANLEKYGWIRIVRQNTGRPAMTYRIRTVHFEVRGSEIWAYQFGHGIMRFPMPDNMFELMEICKLKYDEYMVSDLPNVKYQWNEFISKLA